MVNHKKTALNGGFSEQTEKRYSET